ncbi:MAG: methyltransferase domain-containing protein [Eggerthellaceae bacterium]|nr:methyltransferase domain-containing protein [Eggerthellaceae bacterium]
MAKNFTPLLSNTDWNEEWMRLQQVRQKADDARHWDARAKSFGQKDAPTPYVKAFIERAGLQPFESVLDMGCGTGALAIPLARLDHPVIAADFSSGMLEVLQKRVDAAGLCNLAIKLMSWEDDWLEHGLSAGSVDVALASRSIATANLKESLLRLDKVARRRVCVTIALGASPRIDERIIKAVGLQRCLGNDSQYAFNILVNEGITPEVSYIKSVRKESFATCDEAHEYYSRMIFDSAQGLSKVDAAQVSSPLAAWLDDNLVANPLAGKVSEDGICEKALCLETPQITTWAFIAWDK